MQLHALMMNMTTTVHRCALLPPRLQQQQQQQPQQHRHLSQCIPPQWLQHRDQHTLSTNESWASSALLQ